MGLISRKMLRICWQAHGRNYGLGMDASGRTLLEHERNYDLGMDALVTVCFWSAYAFGTRTELWFGHGCSDDRMRLEHERSYGLGTDALVTVCSWNTNGILVWARMLW